MQLAAQAQVMAPSWAAAITGNNGQTDGTSQIRGTTVDASGNVFVTGNFTGQVAFGSTLLTSVGADDLFVAKYVPATATWAWALSGGGTGSDQGNGIAVSGTSVYITGFITNTLADAQLVRFRGTGTTPGPVQQNGASTALSTDVVVAKYTDNGTSATLGWTQVGGGTGADVSQGIAVSRTSVYVTGSITNTSLDGNTVRFGGTGIMPGSVQQNGASTTASADVMVAKYTDNGTSATLGWTQVGGGTGPDQSNGIAVRETSVYITGYITNTLLDGNTVRFNDTGTMLGTVQQNGASVTASTDVMVAKYTDNGASGALGWTQVGGGTGADAGQGIAVSGTSVYATGFITNTLTNTQFVSFGGTGTTSGTVQQNGASVTASTDIVVAKYTDNSTSATLGWTQVGGGTGADAGQGIAVRGTNVYATGFITNNLVNTQFVSFGGTGTTPGTMQQNGASTALSTDVLMARYTDNGPSATLSWTQVGGGTDSDQSNGLAVSGTNVYATGYVTPEATFGSMVISSPPTIMTNFLALLIDASTSLPVVLTAFTATLAPDGSAVRLAWAIACKKNSQLFEVERSTDGQTFTSLSTVSAAGTDSGPRTYVFVDKRLPATALLLYYRLYLVDTDGTATYSPVHSVTRAAAGLLGGALSAYPNPAYDAVQVTGAMPNVPVSLFDELGRPIATDPASAEGTATLVLPGDLTPGLYVLRSGPRSFHLTVK